MLCRIYKKNNTPRAMDHEREESMDDVIGTIPPSVAVGQQHVKLQLQKTTTSYGPLLDNYQNLFGEIVSSDGINSASTMSQLASSSSKPELYLDPVLATSNDLPLKRTLPSLYWNKDQDAAGSSSSKRLHFDDSDESVARTDGNASTSISTLLSHLPQTPSFHPQVMLGSIGDSLFRAPSQLQGLNWYA